MVGVDRAMTFSNSIVKGQGSLFEYCGFGEAIAWPAHILTTSFGSAVCKQDAMATQQGLLFQHGESQLHLIYFVSAGTGTVTLLLDT